MIAMLSNSYNKESIENATGKSCFQCLMWLTLQSVLMISEQCMVLTFQLAAGESPDFLGMSYWAAVYYGQHDNAVSITTLTTKNYSL